MGSLSVQGPYTIASSILVLWSQADLGFLWQRCSLLSFLPISRGSQILP